MTKPEPTTTRPNGKNMKRAPNPAATLETFSPKPAASIINSHIDAMTQHLLDTIFRAAVFRAMHVAPAPLAILLALGLFIYLARRR